MASGCSSFESHSKHGGGFSAGIEGECWAVAEGSVGVFVLLDLELPGSEIVGRSFDRFEAGDRDPDFLERLGVFGEVSDCTLNHWLVGGLELADRHQAGGRGVDVWLAAGGGGEAAALLVEARLDVADASKDVGNRPPGVLQDPDGRRGRAQARRSSRLGPKTALGVLKRGGVCGRLSEFGGCLRLKRRRCRGEH